MEHKSSEGDTSESLTEPNTDAELDMKHLGMIWIGVANPQASASISFSQAGFCGYQATGLSISQRVQLQEPRLHEDDIFIMIAKLLSCLTPLKPPTIVSSPGSSYSGWVLASTRLGSGFASMVAESAELGSIATRNRANDVIVTAHLAYRNFLLRVQAFLHVDRETMLTKIGIDSCRPDSSELLEHSRDYIPPISSNPGYNMVSGGSPDGKFLQFLHGPGFTFVKHEKKRISGR
ncbi:hypothetical protein F4680DRAFT_454728 [Xylaria scruposa]|nr:hypothetical protein F4680DRAFT_454728 [Xylaria scruposa]